MTKQELKDRKEKKALADNRFFLSEALRLNFVLQRDGVDGACIFAEEVIDRYKAALKYPKPDKKATFARLREYRRRFIISIYTAKLFLAVHKENNHGI